MRNHSIAVLEVQLDGFAAPLEYAMRTASRFMEKTEGPSDLTGVLETDRLRIVQNLLDQLVALGHIPHRQV